MARLLFDRLHEPDEALDVLDFAWPLSSQAEAALREGFRLRGVLGRHEQTRSRILGVFEAGKFNCRIPAVAGVGRIGVLRRR